MSVQDFLNRIEATGLINPALMAELRKRVADSNRRLRPEMIAKLLVDRGELTAAQARKLVLDSIDSSQTEEEEEDIFTGEPVAESHNDDLTFADDDLLVSDTDLVLGTEMVPGTEQPGDDTELTLADEQGASDNLPEAVLVEDDDDDVIPEAIVHSGTDDNLQNDDLRDLLDRRGDDDEQGTVLQRRSFLGHLFDQLFRKKKTGRKKSWDSPLILLGGGALVLMLAAGFGIFSLLYNENVDEIYAAGEEAYQSQAYGVAIEKFERLAANYPTNENASIARVRAELSRLRQHTDASRADWTTALRQAQQGLPTIGSEEALADVRAELAKLLPDITKGLVDQSSSSGSLPQKKELLALAVESLDLVHDPVYLPTTVKKTQELRIEAIQAQIDAVGRDIQREEALAATAERIGAAAAEGQIVEAYSLRDDLVAKYPILIGNTTLHDALRNVAGKERAAVRSADSDLKPQQSDHAPVSRVQLVLCDRRGTKANGVDGRVFSHLARGAVYALDAADGKVLWRRFVGYETDVFPQKISEQPQSDLLLVDGVHSEVQRVAAKTGKLRWRVRCPAPLSSPRIVGDRAFVTCGPGADSRLLAIDLSTGDVKKEIRFPVGCQTTPGLIGKGKELAAVGIHSSVYIIDIQTMECTSVIPTGHRRGSIVTSPVWVGNMLVLAENTGNRSARLQPYRRLDKGGWTRVAAPIQVKGKIVAPLLVDSRRLMVYSEQGEIRIFEVPIDGAELREIASVEGTDANLGRSHAQFFGSQIWVADQKLARYQLQATRGELVHEWIRDRRDRFQSPIERIGDYVFSARQRNGMLGQTVAAHAATGPRGEPVWETDLAVPSQILVSSSDSVYAVTANGAMFPIDSAAVKAGVTDRRQARIDTRLLPTAFSQMVPVAADRVVFAGPPPTKHMIVADLSRGSLDRVPLRIDTDVASTPLVAIQNALLVACETGPIHCLDFRSGRQITNPFVPRIRPGQQIDWMLPAALPPSQFVAAEKGGALYLVLRQGNKLSVAKEAQITGPFVAGLATVGTMAFGVTNTAGVDEVIAINAALEVVRSSPLNSGIAWGPKRVGDHVLVADGSHVLTAFDTTGNLKWTVSLETPLAGDPLQRGGDLVVTTTGGRVLVIDGSAGTVAAEKQLSEPLGGGVVAYKGRLLIVGWDGTLYLVDVPK